MSRPWCRELQHRLEQLPESDRHAFAQAQSRREALRPFVTLANATRAAACTRDQQVRDGIVAALVAEYRATPCGLWSTALVAAMAPALASIARGLELRIEKKDARSTVQLAFEVPAHAATPRLRGSYESFVKQADHEESDTDAEVEFLVLNEQQFADFLKQRAGEATFSAEDAHAHEVNTSLPPTLNQPEKYHLIFRNNSRGPEKKFVQADFRMEF